MTEHILFLSYGKDSLACLGAIEKLGWPLDRIVHAEIWATCDISADLPPMVEFKKRLTLSLKSVGVSKLNTFPLSGGGARHLRKTLLRGLAKGKVHRNH